LEFSAFKHNFSASVVSSNCCCLFLLLSSISVWRASSLVKLDLSPVEAGFGARPSSAAVLCPRMCSAKSLFGLNTSCQPIEHLLFIYFTLLGALLAEVGCVGCSLDPLGLAGRFCGALAGLAPAVGTAVCCWGTCGPKPLEVLLLILSPVEPTAICCASPRL